MVNDQEPRYRLVDENGNVVGTLFAESDGTLKLQEGTSGNDNELSLTTQGALEVEQRSVAKLGGRAYLSSNQTLSSSGVGEEVVFDVEERDDFGEYDPTTGILTVSKDGVYLLFASLTAAFSGSDLKTNIRINGGSVTRNRERVDGFQASVTSQTVIELAAGDTVDVRGTQYTGGSDDLVGGNELTTSFEWTYLG